MRRLFSLVVWLLVLCVAGLAGLWFFGPDLISPRESFEQGPSGVVAYISLANQLRSQAPAFVSGQDVRLTMNQEEFSGMVSSALLSGRRDDSPIRKVRTYLTEGQLQVDAIVELPYPQVPDRFRNRPIGLTLDLKPEVSATGQVQFRITHAKLGRLPVPVGLIKWAGQRFPLQVNGYDAKEATIQLPIGDMIASNFGRNLTMKEFRSTQGQLTLVMAMSRSKK